MSRDCGRVVRLVAVMASFAIVATLSACARPAPSGGTDDEWLYPATVTEYVYDGQGRLKSKTMAYAKDGREGEREEYKWTGTGLLEGRLLYYDGKDGGDWEERSSYDYDDKGRVTTEERWEFGYRDGGRLASKTSYEYEDLPDGGIRRTGWGIRTGRDAGDRKTSRTKSRTWTYDSEGYLTEEEGYGSGGVVSTVKKYDRSMTSKMDDILHPSPDYPASYEELFSGMGQRYEFNHDADGNIVSITAVTSPDADRRLVEERFYDGKGQLSEVNSPAFGDTPAMRKTYVYDEAGRLMRETFELAGDVREG